MEEPKLYKVYIHTNKTNGKKYVGITCQDLHRRYGNGRGYKESPKFWNAIQKYGWDSMITDVVFWDLTKEEAEQKEIHLIKLLNTTNDMYGYNIQNGGNSKGTHSKLTKAKIGMAHRGRVKSEEHLKKLKEVGIIHSSRMTGKGNPFFGKKHGLESRKKISESRKGISNPLKVRKVVQLGKNDAFIKAYESMNSASRETGVILSGICEACNGNQKTSGGFKWMYLEEYESVKHKEA